jgi:hypothetical protein
MALRRRRFREVMINIKPGKLTLETAASGDKEQA